MSALLRLSPTAREREVIVAVANDRLFDVSSSEWEASPLLAIAASFAAINEIWTDEQNAHVIDELSALLTNEDPAIVAGAATRAAILAHWWDHSGRENPNGKATRWARIAVKAQPSWVLNWLVLYDCLSAQGQFSENLKIAQHLSKLPAFVPPVDPFDYAFETIFTGRLNWDDRTARELLAEAKIALDANHDPSGSQATP